MRMQDWTRLPTKWLEAGGLARFGWQEHKSDGTAALMLLITIVHHADPELGMARLTYTELCDLVALSRTKAAGGLGLLTGNRIIEVPGRSHYLLADFNPAEGWAKLPARKLYSGGSVTAFRDFHLRKAVELNALKLYLMIAARRDRATNFAHCTYDQIEAYAGIDRAHIKSAISFLAAHGLIHVEHIPSRISEYGISNAYRLVHLHSYTHMGTRGRGLDLDAGVSDITFDDFPL